MSNIPLSSKIALTGGKDFWHTHAVPEAGLPEVMLADGPHGIRKQSESSDHLGLGQSEQATCFPPAVGLSSTWNRDLIKQVGVALGQEARALGVGVLLGPGVNIKRNPLCGRNFEYFSEDPYLTGELATALVKGVQSQGVGTSLKHYAANNQETDRMRRDSQVDERTLREIYLRAFGKVVTQAQPWTVMCSYNKVNGTYASENHWLLTEVLREEWGFEGFVVSDWGAVIDRVKALKAGLDLEMPSNQVHEDAVMKAFEAGEIDESTIDQAYSRVERVLRRAVETQAEAPGSFDAESHHRLARRAAEQSIVLLTNNPSTGAGHSPVLPLAPESRVAVVGEFARAPRYQGAGSSRVNPLRVDNALDAINALAGREVPFAPGFTTDPRKPVAEGAREEAVAIAKEADVVLAFLGLGENHESEGYDRESLQLPDEQLALLEAILQVNSNVVVVLSNGSSVLLPFADRVPAVVEGWLLGQAGGPALADVLYGVVNPSGKITETIPLRVQDVPSYLHFPGDETGVHYGEGLFVGYRGYDAADAAVAFPFGHGLSYTTFDYSGLDITASDAGLSVAVTVTNTGERAGREIVQAYVSHTASKVVRVPRELKGFTDTTLEPGASERVTIEIPLEELAYWSVTDSAWVIEGGTFLVQVGASSRDLRVSASVHVAGNEPKRLLTLHSTMAEAMANPTFAQGFKQIMGQTFGDLANDDSLGGDMAKMAEGFPVFGIVGFSGESPEKYQRLLDAANAESGTTV